jgi:Flp pilus assembly pilin Flp
MIEYSLVLGLIALLIMGLVVKIGAVSEQFFNIATTL